MCVCMFAIGARTVRATGLKFGTELEFHPESVFGYGLAGPHLLGRGGQRVLLEVRAA